ncbi:MAG: aminotransferase class IV [Ginsengibacter sp.]
MKEQFFIYNNKFYESGTPIISPSSRGLRYGDGIFETMKIANGNIVNADFHLERLFGGLALLQFDVPKHFDRDFIQKKIGELCDRNKHSKSVRIRLMITRGDGGIFDPENHFPNYIIESWQLKDAPALNSNGLVIDIFQGSRKCCDDFSHLKSNNYLPYVLAALYAKQHKLNDCILLNSNGRICDTTITNIFLIYGNEILTPPLSEGCVAGTMRRWMLEKFVMQGYLVKEKVLNEEDLTNADECFLTNAIHHIRWVQSFRNKKYTNAVAKKISDYVRQTI